MENLNSTDILEWHLVLRELSKKATSELGKEYCQNLPLAETFDQAIRMQKQTEELLGLINTEGNIPIGGLRNIKKTLEDLSKGAILQGLSFLDISSTLRAVRVLKKFITAKLNENNELYNLIFPLYTNETLESEIEHSFSSDGVVLDSASPELYRIRESIKQTQHNIREKLNKMMQDSRFKTALQEFFITQRNNRYVIPVRAESQGVIKGIVQDQSQSGSTVYIEPMGVVEDNNKLAKKLVEERNEVEKILIEFGLKVLPDISLILNSLEKMTEFDVVFAKAHYGISINATKPNINNYGFVELRRLRHPLLISQKGFENVIPIDVTLGKAFDSLIITGSNTGGKTVTLKTLGISALMVKAGLYLPSGIDSEMTFFEKVLADIGDEQSLEQNLSTFSAHLVNINKIIENADKNSLILIDEIGTGTDPTEGSAIAQAIIEKLREKEAKIVVTTHYGELKTLAYKYTGISNASVEFNIETLSPTYRLLLGIPGKSNAVHIAQRLGFEPEVITRAKELLNSEHKDISDSVEKLEKEYKKIIDERSKLEKLNLSLKEKDDTYNKQLQELEIKKKKLKEELYGTFNDEVTKSLEEVRTVVRELQKDKTSQNAEKVRRKIEDAAKNIDNKFKKSTGHVKVPKNELEVQVSEFYYLNRLEQVVQVITEPKDNKVEVLAGALKLSVGINELSKIENKEMKKRVKTLKDRGSSTKVTFEKKPKEPETFRNSFNECDLRGLYVDEALVKATKFLDEASMVGLSPLYIIHGKGSGALRNSIRDLLKDLSYIDSFRAGEYYEGGEGISVIYLK